MLYKRHQGDKMKKLILILMVGSLLANEARTIEVINITQKSKVEVYTALF